MRLIDADDLYQKCIEIQLKKRNRYFDIDDVIKLIKKAPTVDVLDKIRAELHATAEMHCDGYYYLRDEWIDEIFDKYRGESDTNG